MKKEEAKQRIEQLTAEIKRHNHLYFNEGKSKITDYEYDILFRELYHLEEAHPHLKHADSPITTVGSDIDATNQTAQNSLTAVEEAIGRKKHFVSFTHPYPMYSLDNAMNEEEVQDFILRREKDLGEHIKGYSAVLKYDGVAIELIYEKGALMVGVTRGNGAIGEDITANIKTVSNIPKKLKINFSGQVVVRGEVIMLKSVFHQLNVEKEKNGKSLIANPRNAAAGSLLQIDTEATAKRKLTFFAYQLIITKELVTQYPHLTTQSSQLKMLATMGFEVSKNHFAYCANIEELKKFYEVQQKEREALPFDVDGVVVIIDDEATKKRLGVAGRKPRFAIAWKFPPIIVETILEDIQFQVGRTGVITPVGMLKSVNIGGAWVKRVTLHNKNEIDSKDIRIGDTVQVIRSGDVIPKILAVVTQKRQGNERKINFPNTCPMCKQPVHKNTNVSEVLIFCTNLACVGKIKNAFIHFVSKEAMNIEGLGREFVLELIEKKIINRFEDIYFIRGEDLDAFERMGDKLKENLIVAIENSKQTTLGRFIYALGIIGVGQILANTLAKKFKNIENLLSIDKQSLVDMDKIGEVIAENIVNFFHAQDNVKTIKNLIQAGVKPMYEDKIIRSVLNGKRFLFTGTLSLPRHIAKEKAERLGAEIASILSAKVDYLVAGDKPGSKLKKAEELNVKIISEKEFFEMLENYL